VSAVEIVTVILSRLVIGGMTVGRVVVVTVAVRFVVLVAELVTTPLVRDESEERPHLAP
jgi:hypothetical protein